MERVRLLTGILIMALMLFLSSGLNAQSLFGDEYWNTNLSPVLDMNGQIFTVAVDQHANIYIGGSFTVINGITVNHIARWDQKVWTAIGSGVDGDVHAIAFLPTDKEPVLCVGGSFKHAGGIVASGIAEFGGGQWISFGEGLPTQPFGVYSIIGDQQGNVYAAGGFEADLPNGDTLRNIAEWNPSLASWKPLAGGVTNRRGALPVWTMQLLGDSLFVGGFFSFVDHGLPASGVARWSGGKWSSVGTNDPSTVSVLALAYFQQQLYAGGEFSSIGGTVAHNIATWDGTQWQALSDDPGFVIGALAVGKALYAGHEEISGTGTKFNNIASWDGSTWQSLGSGVNSGVNALAPEYIVGVVAVGYFDTAGGKRTNGIAVWHIPQTVANSAPISDRSLAIFPQPVATHASIKFTLNKPSKVEWGLSNVLGQTLYRSGVEVLSAGEQTLSWDRPTGLSDGVYLLRLQNNTGEVKQMPILLLR